MRFNGKSGVEVRLPNDLEDLKGYTSLSLFLQRPDSRENGGTNNMFVMYLGKKDVSIFLRFLLFLKQNMVLRRDTTVSLSLAQQEESPPTHQQTPPPLMAPHGASCQSQIVGCWQIWKPCPMGPACGHTCVYM